MHYVIIILLLRILGGFLFCFECIAIVVNVNIKKKSVSTSKYSLHFSFLRVFKGKSVLILNFLHYIMQQLFSFSLE